MKKFLLTLLLSSVCLGVCANEITEDYFDIATNYCIEGNYTEAVSYLNKILSVEPDNKTVLDLRNGLNQIIKGNNTSFIYAKSNAVKQAMNAKKNGTRENEVTALTTANDYWANYFLGQYYKQNKNYTNAISYFIKSVNAKPNLTQCYLQIAICHYELKNYSQALTYINQYLKINQQDDFAYSLRARIQGNLGEDNLALNDIVTASAIENSVEYQFLEAKILYKLKRYSQALEKFKNLTSDIQTAEIYKYIGLCQAELKNYPEALINLEKSIILFDDDKTVNLKYNEVKSRIENNET